MSVLIPFDFRKDDRLDGMTVVRPVARGGNGDLYMVRDEHDNLMAVKVIRKTDNDRELAGTEQCRAVSAQIPGLVPVRKTGKLPDGRFYCVMPLADNLAEWPDYEPDTLANRIRRSGSLPPDEVLALTAELAATVGALHDVGLAHCDIKPENILFIDGCPMLSDYSLLADTSDNTGGTCPGTSGTVGFIPPEMVENPACYAPMPSDLYALGKVVYCAWSGMNEMDFPSVSRKTLSLQEMGIMRAVYMKACSGNPAKRFKNADQFIQAVAHARDALENRTGGPGGAGKSRRGLLLVPLLILLCAVGIVNLVILLRRGDGDTERERNQLSYQILPPDGETSGVPSAVYSGDPLVVTTDRDVEDANDGVNSLREALRYAQRHGTNASVTFAGDFDIRIDFTLPVSKNVIIDGESNRITLTGPEEAPLFRVTDAVLTLRNMSLVSDSSLEDGGILEAAASGGANLHSVKDGGTAKWLWSISKDFELNLYDRSHLHRARIVSPRSGQGAIIRIGPGSVLEDSTLSGAPDRSGGNIYVFGSLKNTVLGEFGDIYTFDGRCEDLLVQNNAFAVHRNGGVIHNMRVEPGGIYGVELQESYIDAKNGPSARPMTPPDGGFLTGTVSLAGIVHGYRSAPIVGAETDLVFDLTGRTEDTEVNFYFRSGNDKIYYIREYGFQINNMGAFLGARSYTVRVKPDQPPGRYGLAERAEDFAAPVSLTVGDTNYPDALVPGRTFSAEGRTYLLELHREPVQSNQKFIVQLILTIAEKQD